MARSYRVAVTGSSGSGSSTVGNQLLGRAIFPVSGGLRQCTTTLRHARATWGGVELEVIDVPDYINLNTLPGPEMQRIESPDAVLLTLRRDFKFVREDYDQMHALLNMIPGGSADIAILVITRADDLTPSNFDDEFLRNAGPYLQDLYEETDGRYVLYSTDKDSESLVSDLADAIERMKRSAANRRKLQCVPYAWVLFWAVAWCVSFQRETVGDVTVPQSNAFYLTAAAGPCLILYRKPLRIALRKYARQLKTALYSLALSRFGSRKQ